MSPGSAGRLAPLVALLVLALLAALPGGLAGVGENPGDEVLAVGLGDDDECRAADSGGPAPHCALSAAQLRARKAEAAEGAAGGGGGAAGATALAQKEREEKEGGQKGDARLHVAAEANRSAGAIWPLSPSSTSAPKYEASCYGNAGSAECSKPGALRTAGRCVCESGCMGADGNCYSSDNKVISKDFSVKNMKWPDYKLYVQRMAVFNQMKTTSFSTPYNMGQDQFTLYELPGEFEGHKEYFLASSKWPDYVVAMQGTGGTAVSLWGAYAVSLSTNHQPWNLRDVMLRICSARTRGHPDSIMIGTTVPIGGSTIWAYIHQGSYLVYGYWYPERLIESKILSVGSTVSAGQAAPSPSEFPGDGGYWIPDPPFPKGVIPDC